MRAPRAVASSRERENGGLSLRSSSHFPLPLIASSEISMPLPCAHDARASGARCSGTTLATAVLAVAGAVREVVASVMPARYGCASSVVVALGLLLLAPNASGGKPRPEPEASSVEPVRRQLQVARPKSYFVEVSSGTCETHGHVTIEDGPECKQAAELWVSCSWIAVADCTTAADSCTSPVAGSLSHHAGLQDHVGTQRWLRGRC